MSSHRWAVWNDYMYWHSGKDFADPCIKSHVKFWTKAPGQDPTGCVVIAIPSCRSCFHKCYFNIKPVRELMMMFVEGWRRSRRWVWTGRRCCSARREATSTRCTQWTSASRRASFTRTQSCKSESYIIILINQTLPSNIVKCW